MSKAVYIVGQIDEPFVKGAHTTNQRSVPIKIGQYVTADIQGKTLSNATLSSKPMGLTLGVRFSGHFPFQI